MNSSVNRFILDLNSVHSQISIPVLLGDTGREFRINLSCGASPYTIVDGCLAKLSIKRPTGTHIEEFCNIVNNETLVYPFSQNKNTTAVEGIHECDVTIYGLDGGSVGTARFTMVVSERVVNSDDIVLTDEDLTAVDAMLAKEAERQVLEANRQRCEKDRANAESDRNAAESSRIHNETDRLVNEEERRLKERERISNEAVRVANEAERVSNDAKREILVAKAVEDSSSAKADAELAVVNTESFRAELGSEALITGYPTVKGSVNHAVSTAKDAKDKSDAVETDLVNLQAQVNGIARTYVVYNFPNFIKFLNGEGRLFGGIVVNGIVGVHINSLKTGDNILIKELGVPDFWFDKDSTANMFDTYTYNGVEYSLSSSYGGAHILETDYTVIEGHAISAAKSAADAEHYKDLASDHASFCASEAWTALEYKNRAEEASTNASTSERNAKASEDAALASANIAVSEADRAYAIVDNAKSEIGAELSPMVSKNTEDIAINRKRIINLEQGLSPDPFTTDTTGKVPVNALPYAEVVKVGGMTYRDEATDTLKDTKVTSIESIGADGETVVGILEIPEAVQALEEYGLVVDAEYCNYIDWEKKQYVRRVYKYAVTGREGEEGGVLSKWSVAFSFAGGTDGKFNKFSIRLYPEDGFPKSVNVQSTINLVSNHYTPSIRTVVYNQDTDGVVSAFAHSQGYTLIEIAVRDISTKEAMIQQLKDWYDSGNPLTIVYKLEEPIATPIGDLLPEDNFIKVEGGGTIKAVNEYNLEAPTEIKYMLKEVTE